MLVAAPLKELSAALWQFCLALLYVMFAVEVESSV